MAWDKRTRIDAEIRSEFSFYKSGGLVDGGLSETIEGGQLSAIETFEIREVRLTFSAAFASVEDLVIMISAANGRAYDHVFVSQALSDIENYRWAPANPIRINSGDTLKFDFSMKVSTNLWGIEVQGWAVST